MLVQNNVATAMNDRNFGESKFAATASASLWPASHPVGPVGENIWPRSKSVNGIALSRFSEARIPFALVSGKAV
jgi:hypothetical protein